ncbi:MAG: hypothetical protein D8M58_11820 [Calditrichaeota bacterium]|nr:MAG: hypothetical protein DWQ03_12605 [Calditrichota bacterium]MBL1206083.1 hypothetical protein [Calditrichota bacterium]
MKSNKITWIVLVVLTIIGYLFSDSSFSGTGLALLILSLYGLKFLGIGFQYMELKDAHFAWKFLLPLIFLVFITFITITINF